MRPAFVITAFIIVAAAVLPSPAAAQQIHQDTIYGYKIGPPVDWPLSTRATDSDWIIAKFISKKPTYYNDPEGWTWTYTPEITVIAFIHDVIKGDKVKKEEDEDGKVRSITIRDPYKDYKDYLKRTYYGGGYYFSNEEVTNLKGVDVTCYEIKVEKLTNTGPRRIIAWVYHLEKLDIAVQFEILEESYTKLRGDILRTLKSFRVIDREGELPTESAGRRYVTRVDWDELDLEERNEKRRELEQKAHDKALADLPKGWKRSKVGRILVLDSVNPGKAKKIAQQCDAIMNWLDKNLDFIGPGEYVRSPILKLFKAEDPNSFYISYGTLDNIVIEYEHNPDWLSEFRFEIVSRRAMEIWFADRDRELYWAMPNWVDRGLADLFENSRAKGRRLEFPKDIYDKVRLKQALSRGELSTARELIMMGSEEFRSGRYKVDEASALVRFLLVGPGSKSKKTREVLRQYLQNLAEVTSEIKEEEKDVEIEKPKTEEEEDEYFKRKQNAWKDKEKRILEDTFSRTFFDWDESDWKAFEAAYKRMIDD